MKNILKTITIFLLVTLFTSNSIFANEISNDECSLNYKRYYKQYNGYSYDTNSEPMINYKNLADDAIKTVLKDKPIPKLVVVTDFVDLSSLKNSSKIGYILSNSIKNSLINLYKVNVIESEISKYFKLSQNGLRLLTRDIKNVKSTKYNVQEAIVGTYTKTENELIIFVKLIDLKTGIIKGSYTNSLLMGKDTLIELSYEK